MRTQHCPLCDFRFLRPSAIKTKDLFTSEFYKCDCGMQFACVSWTFQGKPGKSPIICIEASTNPEDAKRNQETIFKVLDKEVDVMIKTSHLWQKRLENLKKLTETRK